MIQTLEELFDECSRLQGSHAALARHLGVGRQQVQKWRTCARPVPASVLASLADLAQLTGDEARRVLADAECRNPKHATFAEVMRRAFFGVVALGVALAGLSSTDSRAQSVERFRLTVYTLCAQVEALLGALWRVRPSGLRPWRASVLNRYRLGLPPPRRSSDCPRFALP